MGIQDIPQEAYGVLAIAVITGCTYIIIRFAPSKEDTQRRVDAWKEAQNLPIKELFQTIDRQSAIVGGFNSKMMEIKSK